jgi:hypothetical protein
MTAPYRFYFIVVPREGERRYGTRAACSSLFFFQKKSNLKIQKNMKEILGRGE